jgi:hypothetical protein
VKMATTGALAIGQKWRKGWGGAQWGGRSYSVGGWGGAQGASQCGDGMLPRCAESRGDRD